MNLKLACSRLWDLCQKPLVEEGLEEARELQGLIAQADWAASKSNVSLFLSHYGGLSEQALRFLG